jgi:hypothetical protein
MARKVFKTEEYILHLVTSNAGVMIVKLIDKHTKEYIEQRIFTDSGDEFTDYVEQYKFNADKIINYLNTK